MGTRRAFTREYKVEAVKLVTERAMSQRGRAYGEVSWPTPRLPKIRFGWPDSVPPTRKSIGWRGLTCLDRRGTS
jgi:hypothetical protein